MKPVWVWSNFVDTVGFVAAFAWDEKTNIMVSNIADIMLMSLLFIVSVFIATPQILNSYQYTLYDTPVTFPPVTSYSNSSLSDHLFDTAICPALLATDKRLTHPTNDLFWQINVVNRSKACLPP